MSRAVADSVSLFLVRWMHQQHEHALTGVEMALRARRRPAEDEPDFEYEGPGGDGDGVTLVDMERVMNARVDAVFF